MVVNKTCSIHGRVAFALDERHRFRRLESGGNRSLSQSQCSDTTATEPIRGIWPLPGDGLAISGVRHMNAQFS
jgi:hypothetical protein